LLDCIIRNGNVVDGTGAPRRRADVGIAGDRIAEIGQLGGAEARIVIDAAGKIVAPGFIDVHNHSDAWLLKMPHLAAKTRQGFTTEVIMADGISYAPVNEDTAPEWIYYLRALNGLTLDEYRGWQSLADYLSLLDGRNVQNVAAHLPYANVRTLFCGFGRGVPDDYQMAQIKAAVRQGMEEGAVGLSTGLDYTCQWFSSTEELVEACSAMADVRGLYVTHVRYKKGVLAGIQEAAEIGRQAGVPVHISHLKGINPEDAEAVLAWLEGADARGDDLSFDVYPYLPGSTMLHYFLPYEVWEDGPLAVTGKLKSRVIRDRFARSLEAYSLENVYLAWVAGKEHSRYQGRPVREFVEDVGKPAADALCDLLIEERLAVLMVHRYPVDDSLVEPFLAHPRFMLGSDGIYFPDGVVHPRVYGSAARVLGSCVRQKRLFSLEAAVRKLSGFPAERFGLRQRGRLAAGYFADVVVFDEQTIADRATYDQPHQFSNGVEHVLVNGVPILRDSAEIEGIESPLPGRYLKSRHD
jgi:N-acyl-D-amino-acid deacylase